MLEGLISNPFNTSDTEAGLHLRSISAENSTDTKTSKSQISAAAAAATFLVMGVYLPVVWLWHIPLRAWQWCYHMQTKHQYVRYVDEPAPLSHSHLMGVTLYFPWEWHDLLNMLTIKNDPPLTGSTSHKEMTAQRLHDRHKRISPGSKCLF